jgi:hypothetical protein
MLGWLVYEHGIEPHVSVFDQSARTDGTFSRDDFTYDHEGDGRLRLRGPNGARDEFHLVATAQNLRKLAKLVPMAQPKPA